MMINEYQQTLLTFLDNEFGIKFDLRESASRNHKHEYVRVYVGEIYFKKSYLVIYLHEDYFNLQGSNAEDGMCDFWQQFKYDFDHNELRNCILDGVRVSLRELLKGKVDD